jgi:endonuclease/exonuclease/phosphatase family metal-dependent hydrolase
MKILTLNTWGTRGPVERQAVLLEAIRSLKADILCLQEISDPKILDSLPYPHRVHVPDSWLALLSRFPVTSQRFITYQTISRLEPYRRQALLTELKVGLDILTIVNTHLAWQAADESTRLMQVEELLETIAPLGDRILLSGDFNASPETEVIRRIRESGFVDLFAQFHPRDPGITWDNRNPFIQSHSVKFPDRRIDYLVLHEKAGEWAQATHCEVVCQAPTPEGIYPSDHYGVLGPFRPEP